jgi:hypothetical protein
MRVKPEELNALLHKRIKNPEQRPAHGLWACISRHVRLAGVRKT